MPRPAPSLIDPLAPLRSFGRIKARALTARQQGLMDQLLPHLAIPEAPQAPLDPARLMPGAEAVVFEIGFGGGEHLTEQAARHPATLFIGAEPFLDGVAKALSQIEDANLANVRLIHGDGRPALAALVPGSLDRLVILFPDPWQKARHTKRRLIQPAFLDSAARALKPGGELRFATDWADYADWTLERLAGRPEFEDLTPGVYDQPPQDHLVTRYQAKALGDCAPVFLRFARR
jgi:tRNA (guanine-N7-)-methyltransferase